MADDAKVQQAITLLQQSLPVAQSGNTTWGPGLVIKIGPTAPDATSDFKYFTAADNQLHEVTIYGAIPANVVVGASLQQVVLAPPLVNGGNVQFVSAA